MVAYKASSAAIVAGRDGVVLRFATDHGSVVVELPPDVGVKFIDTARWFGRSASEIANDRDSDRRPK